MILPWPHKYLNPNSNANPYGKARVKKKYRRDCCILTKAEGKRKFPDGPINLKVTFYPPNAIKRDLDNMIASMKSGFDGMADAWGVDDNRFRFEFVLAAPGPGAVKVEALLRKEGPL